MLLHPTKKNACCCTQLKSNMQLHSFKSFQRQTFLRSFFQKATRRRQTMLLVEKFLILYYYNILEKEALMQEAKQKKTISFKWRAEHYLWMLEILLICIAGFFLI